MIETIIAALITGGAAVIAAKIAKTDTRSKGSGTAPAPSLKMSLGKYIALFVVGAVAGALLIYMVAQAVDKVSLTHGYKVPVGTIIAYMGKEEPDGWLFCDGKPVGREYKELRKMVGPTTPDLRGRFLRGLDQSGTNVLSEKGRQLGSLQEDDFKKHSHSVMQWNGGDGNRSGHQDALYAGIKSKTGEEGGDETRPKNVAVNFIIKY
jgi:microcystin-dependent protein